MAKITPSKPVSKLGGNTKAPLIPEKYQDLFFILALVASVFVFFWAAIAGGGFNSSDNVASNSFITYLNDAKNSGHFPLWIPYIFGGMPSYASLMTTGDRSWDFIAQLFFGITKFVGSIFASDVARVACFYAIYGVGVYLLMRSKKHERYISFISAFAAIFSTYVITWIMIGHNTKPIVLAMFPYLFLFLEKLREKFSLVYTVLLIFALHIMLEGGHVQMMFYGGCAVAIYFVLELISRITTKNEPVKVLRPAIVLVAAAAIAFMMSSDRYLSTFEYSSSSTRGLAPMQTMSANHQTGNVAPTKDYKYSTMWSYSPSEMMSFLVPSFFGAHEQIEFQGSKYPTYFGQKDSEDSPPYMGIAILGLALVGFILYRKDTFVQSMFAISVFSVLLSFGKNSMSITDAIPAIIVLAIGILLVVLFRNGKLHKIPFFAYIAFAVFYFAGLAGIHNFDILKIFDFFFYHVPMFSTFRAPSMSLAMMHFAVPVLAGYGMTGIVKMRKSTTQNEKKLLLGVLITTVAFLLLAVIYTAGFESSFMSAARSGLAHRFGTDNIPEEFTSFVWKNMQTDWFLNAIFACVAAISAWFFVKGKLNKTMFLSVLAIITIVDLWRVDYRPMDISEKTLADEFFKPYQQLYEPLTQDKSVFRIADFVAPHDNLPAYFKLQSVNGYHPAKLRVYQDLMDIANVQQMQGSTGKLVNPFLWNLMNVKYIIDYDRASKAKIPKIYPNPDCLPRAFFVNQVQVAQPIDILYHLRDGNFKPREVAYVETELPQAIQPADSALATAQITDYQNEDIKIDVNATGNNLLFMSEVYYKPSWKAYIDGKEVPIIKTNYAFRSVIVPQGKHTVEMKFISEKFESGKSLSLTLNIVSFLALAVGIVLIYTKKNKKVSDQSSDNDAEK